MSGQRCDTIINVPVSPGWCPQPAVGFYRRGCVHEHVKDGWLCERHAGNPESNVWKDCWELPTGSHECPVLLQRLPELEATP